MVVEVELHGGQTGVGVSIGGAPACFIVENHLARYVEGQDVRNVELVWEQMFRGTLNYGRKGLPLQARAGERARGAWGAHDVVAPFASPHDDPRFLPSAPHSRPGHLRG